MQNEIITSNIKQLCKQKGISLNSVLLKCSLTKSFVYDLEKRNSSPSCDKISRIADYLDCSVDYLLGRTDVVEVNKGYGSHPTYGELAAQGGIENQEPPKKKPEIL